MLSVMLAVVKFKKYLTKGYLFDTRTAKHRFIRVLAHLNAIIREIKISQVFAGIPKRIYLRYGDTSDCRHGRLLLWVR